MKNKTIILAIMILFLGACSPAVKTDDIKNNLDSLKVDSASVNKSIKDTVKFTKDTI